MDQRDWLKGFVVRRSPGGPDGRALYSYKCKDKEYDAAKRLSRQMLENRDRQRRFPMFEPIFCLFAAETWRREHQSGPWAWHTIFDAIDAPTPDAPRIHRWIEEGLKHWRRPILRGPGGSRRFLVTIACEGGLPLRLLHKEGASLTCYFRELLVAFHQEGRQGGLAAETLARRLALRLPSSLRQDVVFELSGRLIEAVVALQARVGDVDDAIAFLDARDPIWRDALPLPMADDTVEALLGNLVHQAQALQRDTAAQIRWQRELRNVPGGWLLVRALDLPQRITQRQLADWTGWREIPPRLRLLLTHNGITETIALITLASQTGGDRVYRCEPLRRHRIELLGASATSDPTLSLGDGSQQTRIPAVGEEDLGDLPWVFVERAPSLPLAWLGEGSTRTRREVAVVVASEEDLAEAEGVGSRVDPIGRLVEPQRTIYRVQGGAVFGRSDDGITRVICATDEDVAEGFLLDGPRLDWTTNRQPVHVGIPRVIRTQAGGGRDFVPATALEWRPLGAAGSGWSRGPAGCVGRVWLRYRDPRTGDLRLRRQADVVPALAQVRYRIGTANQSGVITLSGLAGAQIRVGSVQDVDRGS